MKMVEPTQNERYRTDIMERTLIEELTHVIKRKTRFVYDLRSRCQVYNGIVAAYGPAIIGLPTLDLSRGIDHALKHDGILWVHTDPSDDKIYYYSCRIFTDLGNALCLARSQGQRSILNLNRDMEVDVEEGTGLHMDLQLIS